MFKNLSKSVGAMFLFDLLILTCFSFYFYKFFNLNSEYIYWVVGSIVIVGFVALFLKDNYKIREFNNTIKNAWLLFEGVVFAHVPALVLLYFFVHQSASVKFLAINIIAIFAALKLYRFFFHYYLFNLKKIKKVLIVGNGKNAELVKELIANKFALKMEVVGNYFNEEITSPKSAGADNEIGNNKMLQMSKIISEITKVAHEKEADIIIDAFDDISQFAALVLLMKSYPVGLKFYSVYDFYEKATGKSIVDTYTAENLLCNYRNKPMYDFCKRIYDIVAAMIILTVTFPILLYIGIRVKLTDGGKVIYTQNRVGIGGKIFKAYKIRTMYANDFVPNQNNISEQSGQDEDSRVIPFCRWVRKARFDEIPQMINILKGEMSIVGPRAEWEDLVKIYKNKIEYYYLREIVNTGWTGWAQINQGHCISEDDIREKLEYDVYFIKHKNVLWEIGILVKAVFLALGGRHG